MQTHRSLEEDDARALAAMQVAAFVAAQRWWCHTGTIPPARWPVKSQMKHVSGGTCAEEKTVLPSGTHSQGGRMSDDVRVELEKLQRLVGMMAIQMFELKRQLEQVERDAISDYELVRAELAQQDQRSAFRGMLP